MTDSLRKKRTAPWRSAEARPRATVPGRHPKAKKGITLEEVERALAASGGLISDAARLLGIDRSTLDARIKKSERLQAHQKQVYEDFIDFCESKLMQAVKKGNIGAVCFVLRTKGRNRGYVEKQEIETSAGEPIRFYMPKKEALPDEEPLATLASRPDAPPTPELQGDAATTDDGATNGDPKDG